MILTLADAIGEEEHSAILDAVKAAQFVDGRETAGRHLADTKRNLQIARSDPALERVSEIVLSRLRTNEPFRDATYPKQLHSLLVSRYTAGMAYGPHIDSALMGDRLVWRSDLSLTLFLNDPAEYEGGEICLESGSGSLCFKLPARHMLCYPTSDLHEVRTVTSGERVVVVAWIQSHVRDSRAREILWDLAQARADIVAREGKSRAFDLVNKAHANLLRRWAEP